MDSEPLDVREHAVVIARANPIGTLALGRIPTRLSHRQHAPEYVQAISPANIRPTIASRKPRRDGADTTFDYLHVVFHRLDRVRVPSTDELTADTS